MLIEYLEPSIILRCLNLAILETAYFANTLVLRFTKFTLSLIL